MTNQHEFLDAVSCGSFRSYPRTTFAVALDAGLVVYSRRHRPSPFREAAVAAPADRFRLTAAGRDALLSHKQAAE